MAIATSTFAADSLEPNVELTRMNLFTAINDAMRIALKSDQTAVRETPDFRMVLHIRARPKCKS